MCRGISRIQGNLTASVFHFRIGNADNGPKSVKYGAERALGRDMTANSNQTAIRIRNRLCMAECTEYLTNAGNKAEHAGIGTRSSYLIIYPRRG